MRPPSTEAEARPEALIEAAILEHLALYPEGRSLEQLAVFFNHVRNRALRCPKSREYRPVLDRLCGEGRVEMRLQPPGGGHGSPARVYRLARPGGGTP